MKLHTHPEEFRELITVVANEKHISESAVERDYYIVMMLKSLADSPYADQCVFKGGTSLSKCYPGSIDRFSEDIDLTCLASKLTNIELSDICPLAKAGQPFEVARENTCEECKYFCRIHYEVDPEYGDKQVHFWMNEEIVTFF